MSARHVLILGGTAEARELADALVADGLRVTTTLAGAVARPRLPAGEVRLGGFGGPAGLEAWIAEHGVSAVVDATHPFAENISASAAEAAPRAGVALVRLQRPGWEERRDDHWHWADDLQDAARTLPNFGGRAFLTTGRQGLAAFAAIDAFFLIRCVQAPAPPLPARHELILARGPYTLAGELALIDRHRLDVLVTKDSGGALTSAKLDAARVRSMPVIVVRRPACTAGRQVRTVAEARAWAARAVSSPNLTGSGRVSRLRPG